MAIRRILEVGADTLRKRARTVDVFDKKLARLLTDMAHTLADVDGLGLAAPQVGILKRVAIVNVGEGVIELINPVIVEKDGEECQAEGCLSVPGRHGIVPRPASVRVKAQDRHGNPIEVRGEGLLARALCHELDHLEGILFIDKMTEEVVVED